MSKPRPNPAFQAQPNVRKKPCPYCGKKLQAANKLKWRNNLARHLGNTCAPFQVENLNQCIRIIDAILAHLNIELEIVHPGNIEPPALYDAFGKERQAAEVAELERLHTLEPRK